MGGGWRYKMEVERRVEGWWWRPRGWSEGWGWRPRGWSEGWGWR